MSTVPTINYSAAFQSILWTLLLLSFLLATPVWLSTRSGRWPTWRKLVTALFCFFFCAAFQYSSGLLNEVALSHLNSAEVAQFTVHLNWVRWFLGPFIGSLGVRVLFLPSYID